jgi:quercetin dioxygenase-like cupin family protein
MRTLNRAACTTALALFFAAAATQADPLPPARVTPDDVTWRPTPSGTQQAILAGNPRSAGICVYRARFPAGFRIPPHAHPDERVVTVLSGTLFVGEGAHFDESALTALPAGSMFTEPAGHPHFVWAKSEMSAGLIGNASTSNTTSPAPRGVDVGNVSTARATSSGAPYRSMRTGFTASSRASHRRRGP